MIRILKNISIISFLFCILISLQILAFPFEVQNDSNDPNSIDKEPIPNEVLQASASSASQYKSGDTIYEICEEYVFQSISSSFGSDCWGWADSSGTEYAIFGVGNRVEFYNLDTYTLVGSIFLTNTRWHDIKTYKNYCYAVSSDTGLYDGLTIIDMKYLPDSVHLVKRMPLSDGTTEEYPTASHNITIDTITGYLYSEAYPSINYPFTDVRITSLADPENPEYIKSFGPNLWIHDIFCHNDTLYMAEKYEPSFSIWDMADKNFPQLLTRITVPNGGIAHNIWPTGDKKHVITTEETHGKTIKLWNIEDLNNIQLLDEYNVPGSLAHNAHVIGDTAYISCYESGVIGLDLSNPDSIVELFQFDTYPNSEGPQFRGCWGVYPHTPSGKIYASNIDGAFYILKSFPFVLTDSLFVIDAQAEAGSKVKVDIKANFSLPISGFEIPFNWDGPLNLTFDSASTQGLMTEYFEVQQITAIDLWNKRAAYAIRANYNNMSPDLPVGEGVILTLHFTVPNGTSGAANQITLTPFGTKEASFQNKCISYTPDILNGSITLGHPPCCVNLRGNIDDDPQDASDISDLVFLVDFIFTGGPSPACTEEADITADLEIDISDLVALVDFIFTNGPAPLDCP